MDMLTPTGRLHEQQDNFFVYTTHLGQLQFIPWGVDATFQPNATFGGLGATNGPVAVAAEGLLARRLWLIPASHDAFLQRQRDLLATVWDEAELQAEVDRMEALITPLQDAYAGTGGTQRRRRAQFITNRRAVLHRRDRRARPGRPARRYPPRHRRPGRGDVRDDVRDDRRRGSLGTGSGTFTITRPAAAGP